MSMIELVYTDSSKNDIGVLVGADVTMAYGNDENQLQVTVSRDRIPDGLAAGSLVYAYGTEWGGKIRRIRSNTSDNTAIYYGRTWHGILKTRVIQPDSGADYFSVSGEANAAILAVVSHVGLGDVFSVSTANSGITLPSYQFDRYTDAYTGLCSMLQTVGAKLKVFGDSPKPVLSASAIVDYAAADTIDADRCGIDATADYNPVNHLICGGTGDLSARTIVHLYADKSGKISQTQSIFGEDEVQEFFDDTNASEDDLIKNGTERLEGYQDLRNSDLSIDNEFGYDVGDIVGQSDPITGISVVSKICKATMRLSDGVCSVSYEMGENSVQSSGESSSSSSGGGISYVAGAGIAITGATISADVTQSKLDAVSATASGAATAASNASAAAATAEDDAQAALTGAKSYADGLISTEVTSRNSAIQQKADSITSTVAATYQAKTIRDTRNDNQTPAWYMQNYPKQIVNEFKAWGTIGLTAITGQGFATLLTTVPWADSSGGYPKQQALYGGKTFWRVGTADTAWSAWSDSLSAADAAATYATQTQVTAAQTTASTAVQAVTATSPIAASRTGNTVSLTHATSGVSAGSYGPTTDLVPAFGDTVTIGAQVSIDAKGHTTSATGRKLTIPSAVAASNAKGLMAAADKTKLDSVAANANAYVHPSYTVHSQGLYKVANDATGHVSAASAVAKADITALGIPAQDTTYVPATTAANGLMSAADKAKLNGVATNANNYSLPAATSSSIGGVKPDGTTCTVTADGTLTCTGQAAASFLAAWPVGSIFPTASNVNPGTLYGGTWEEIASLGGYKWMRTD